MKLYKGIIDTYPEYVVCWYQNEPRNLNIFCEAVKQGSKIKIGDYCERYRGFFSDAEPQDYMIDVGGNIGLAAFPVASLGFKVVSFEPVTKNISLFQKGIDINNFQNLVHLEQLALSERIEQKEIYIPKKRADNASLNKTCSTLNVRDIGFDSELIKSTTLDFWFFQNKQKYPIKDAKFLKIDTQGHEFSILRGAKNFLLTAKEYGKLILEIEWDSHFLDSQKINGIKVLELLDSIGYEVFHPEHLIKDKFKSFVSKKQQCDLLCRIKKQ